MTTKVAKKESKFLWIGNSPFLDFINTEMVQAGQPVDLLCGADDVLRWLAEAGFSMRVEMKLDGTRQQNELVAVARGYRQALRSAVQYISAKNLVPSHILQATNQFLLRQNLSFVLSDRGSGLSFQQHWHLERPEDVCAPIAHCFAQFISKADLSRLRKCKNPDCVLFFYDTSKSGTRAWCSLDICGNKMRVAAFRHRAAP